MIRNKPKLSIITVNYNGGKHIFNYLNSVRKSNYADYELIVVDNGSKDGSPDLIKKKYPWVRLILNGKNLGFTGGNNVGMKQAQGDIFFLLSDDTVIHPDLFNVLVSELESSSEIGVVGPKIYYMEPPDKIWFAGGKMDWLKGDTFHLGKDLKDTELLNDSKKEVDYITGCALMIKREVVDKVGMLDESFFIYYEDADLCQRVRRAGYKIIYVPFGGVWHIKSASPIFTLDDLKKELRMAKNKSGKIKIYLRMARDFFINVNKKKYRDYRNRSLVFIRYSPWPYKVIFLLRFAFILTPKLFWEVAYKTPRTLFKLGWGYLTK